MTLLYRMKCNINLKLSIVFLLVTFSGFYLTRIIPISPIYVSFLFASLFAIYFLRLNSKIRINEFDLLIGLNLLYILTSQIFLKPNTSTLVNVVFSLLYFIFIVKVCSSVKKNVVLKYSKIFIWFSIVLLIVEAFWRISHPVFIIDGTDKDYRNIEGMLFYAYKYSSIMFQDSNYVATYALICFFYYYYLFKKKLVVSVIPFVLVAIIVILTFSRSAMLTIPITFFLLMFFNKKVSLGFKVLLISLLILAISWFISKLSSDASFLTKFEILHLFGDYLVKADGAELFFGVGFGNTVNYIGIGAHNLFITYIIESGIIGFLFFIFINTWLVLKTNVKSLILTFPLFISGMSQAGHALTYYYSCVALIYLIEKNERVDFSFNANI